MLERKGKACRVQLRSQTSPQALGSARIRNQVPLVLSPALNTWPHHIRRRKKPPLQSTCIACGSALPGISPITNFMLTASVFCSRQWKPSLSAAVTLRMDGSHQPHTAASEGQDQGCIPMARPLPLSLQHCLRGVYKRTWRRWLWGNLVAGLFFPESTCRVHSPVLLCQEEAKAALCHCLGASGARLMQPLCQEETLLARTGQFFHFLQCKSYPRCPSRRQPLADPQHRGCFKCFESP